MFTAVPENLTETGVVIIIFFGDKVSISYDKQDKFIKTVKSKGYHWDRENKIWFKDIDILSGSCIDRSADIGNELLRCGYIVKFDNEESYNKAVNGDFEPEYNKWIISGLIGDNNNVIIKIPYNNNNIYKLAKHIQGAHWKSGAGMLIPVTSYEEILDFAENMDYKITPNAMKKLNAADEEYTKLIEKRTIISDPKIKSSGNKLSDKLNLGGVIDDLRDEN